MRRSYEDFIKWLEENLSNWKVVITTGRKKRNKYIYKKDTGELIVKNENGSRFTIKRDNLRRICQWYINAPSEKRNRISYYNRPRWKESGLNYKADPYAVHVLKYWWENKTPEISEDIPFDSSEMPSKESLKVTYEKTLEDLIVENFAKIDFGTNLTFIARQYPTDKPDKKIDILAKDEGEKEYVVIELKRGKPSDQVIGQITRYMGWVQKNLAEREDYTTRGIIITTEESDDLDSSLKVIPNVDVYLCNISISLKKII